jgi:hypothetical protein
MDLSQAHYQQTVNKAERIQRPQKISKSCLDQMIFNWIKITYTDVIYYGFKKNINIKR